MYEGHQFTPQSLGFFLFRAIRAKNTHSSEARRATLARKRNIFAHLDGRERMCFRARAFVRVCTHLCVFGGLFSRCLAAISEWYVN